jgi:hypothetical protein
MTIRYLKDVPTAELPGKFMCAPRPGSDIPYGWPALVSKATRGRLTYRRLERGEWDRAADEWRVVPMKAGDIQAEARLEVQISCNPIPQMLICDTAEESISLYVQSLRAEKAIRDYRKAALNVVVTAAVDGALPRAEYLA